MAPAASVASPAAIGRPAKYTLRWDAVPPKEALPPGVDPRRFRVVRIVVISDTHQYHRRLRIPAGDLLLHCGDMLQADSFTLTRGISEGALRDFAEWLNEQPCRHKVVIGGNHDLLLETMGVSAIRSLFASAGGNNRGTNGGGNGAVYLEDEVLRFRSDLRCGDASTRDACAGLTIYGTPRSYANTSRSPNKAFQQRLLWHHSGYGLSYRELAAYRPLPAVMRRLLDPVIVTLSDGSTYEARSRSGRKKDGDSNSNGNGVGNDDDSVWDDGKSQGSTVDGISYPPHRYFVLPPPPSPLLPQQQPPSSASSYSPPSSPAGGSKRGGGKDRPRLINGPPPLIAHIRIAIANDVAASLNADGGAADASASSPSSSTARKKGVDTASSDGGGASGCSSTTILSGAQQEALTAVRRANAISAEGSAVYAVAAAEVFTVEGYRRAVASGDSGNVGDSRPAKGDGANDNVRAADAPQNIGVLPHVSPLPRIDIAMTHQSRTTPLRDLVGAFVQPRLLHAGGHLHEAKGVHTEYTFAPSRPCGCVRRRRVPSVGGAMTQGSFGREWLQPATVIDVVVPWDDA